MMSAPTASTNVRSQRKGQNARQAMIISELSTIYRKNTNTHGIQSHQRSEPRIYLLDITIKDMNALYYPKIHQIIERGRLRPKGTETFFVTKTMEHLILSDEAIYEIRASHQHGASSLSSSQSIHKRIPVDGPITTVEIENNNNTIPVLVDESYYEFAGSGAANERHIIPPNHIVTRHVKKVIKMHEKSMNAFVFILNETESEVVDFYITTENGIDDVVDVKERDPLTRTCKDDIISFIQQFKLCP
jgi:hypothetical protein